MMRTKRLAIWTAWLALVSGCRAPDVCVVVPPAPPASQPPPELPIVSPRSLEPELANLPIVDPATTTPEQLVPRPEGYRGLTEEQCRREAGQRATLSQLVQSESNIPRSPLYADPRWSPVCDEVLRELREHMAAESRNRAVGQALQEFFQLADAEGRGDVVRGSLVVLDDLRARVRKARAEGLKVPIESEDLDQQRAGLITLLGQSDWGARLLDVELKRRIGLSGRIVERIRPTGPFPLPAEPTDADAAVQLALQQRPDLHLLRAAYHRLSPQTLPAIREYLRGPAGLGSLIAPGPLQRMVTGEPGPLGKLLGRQRSMQGPTSEDLIETEVRRQQLHELIAERERQVADQVRTTFATMAMQTRQVGITRWRVEQLLKTAEAGKKDGPLVELPAILEAYRARADLVQAVMTWHLARIRYQVALGAYAHDGMSVPQPPPLPEPIE